MRMKGALIALGIAAMASTAPAAAKEVTVVVDAHSAPWQTGVNKKFGFGLGDARAPTVVWQIGLLSGLKLTISATGRTTTFGGGDAIGPNGIPDWITDRGMALFPSYYMSKKDGPIHLNQLVGCFVNADGVIVGQPFAIGSNAVVEIPEGASALSLGINDDKFSDNDGALTVTISMADPKVTVESSDAKE